MRALFVVGAVFSLGVMGCESPVPPISSSGGAGGGPPVGCSVPWPPFGQAHWGCSQASPCNDFRLTQDGHLYSGETLRTVDDVRCVLRALRDGAPGQYHYVLDVLPMPGLTTDGVKLNVLPNGNVVESVQKLRDLAPTEYTHRYLTRKPKAFFDGCLQQPPGPGLVACMTTWSDNAASGCPVCPL